MKVVATSMKDWELIGKSLHWCNRRFRKKAADVRVSLYSARLKVQIVYDVVTNALQNENSQIAH